MAGTSRGKEARYEGVTGTRVRDSGPREGLGPDRMDQLLGLATPCKSLVYSTPQAVEVNVTSRGTLHDDVYMSPTLGARMGQEGQRVVGNSKESPVSRYSNAPNPEHDLVEKISRMFEAQVDCLISVVGPAISQAISGLTRTEDSPRSRTPGHNIGVENVNASGPEG